MRCIVAIDAGTTGVRAVVFNGDGEALGAAYRELGMHYPRPGWVEQDAEALWSATRAVLAEALQVSRCGTRDVAALGVTNQRASVVAWDAGTGRALSPMIVWQDVRTVARCAELGEQGFFVTPNVSATKMEWIVRNVDAAREASRSGRLRIGTPDSFLCAKLTGGAHVTDHSNACTTGLYAHFDRDWDCVLLDTLSLDRAWLPELRDSSGVVGRTRDDVAGGAVPLAGLCGDQQASLYGLACRAPGLTKCSYGTAAMVDAQTGDSVTVGGSATYPLVAWSFDGKFSYCVEGTVITAGAAVQWLRDGIGLVSDADETAVLASSVPDAGGAWVIPAFQGLGTPYGAPHARAMIGGLSRGTTRAHIARAFLEGIAHRVAEAAESVWEACARPAALRVDGGASRNDVLLQLQADLLGIPVERSSAGDGASLGAAALAARAVGGADRLSDGSWQPQRVFEPALDSAQREELRATWKSRLRIAAQEQH